MGARYDYGVSDDIVSGGKYMGMWTGDVKSEPGCIVSLDAVYYESTLSTGCSMQFDEETSYELNDAK